LDDSLITGEIDHAARILIKETMPERRIENLPLAELKQTELQELADTIA
jgi:hypothetical protein